jgi:hypothetical protein
MTRREARSRPARLLFPHELEAAPGGDRERRSVAIVVHAVLQKLRVEHRGGSGPASMLSRADFFFTLRGDAVPDLPGLERPSALQRMEGSTFVVPCTGCDASGLAACWGCKSWGKESCSSCGNRGWLAGRHHTCELCQGQGLVPCRFCAGTGRVAHEECQGEGRLAKWQEKLFYPVTETIEEVAVPPGPWTQGISEAAKSWVPQAGEPLSELSREAVVERLGYECPDLSQVLELANACEQKFHRRLHAPGYSGGSVTQTYDVIPLATYEYRNYFGRPERFWLVGHGETGVDVHRRDWSISGEWGLWLSFAGSACLMLALFMPRRFRGTGHELLWIVGVTASIASWAVQRPSLRSVLETVSWNIRCLPQIIRWHLRRLGRVPRLRTVAIAAPGNEASTYLACVATLGSYVGRLKVTDPSVRPHLDALINGSAGDTGPSSVVLQAGRNELVRLVSLSSDEIERLREMALLPEAVDGVVQISQSGDEDADAAVWNARVLGGEGLLRLDGTWAGKALAPRALLLLRAGEVAEGSPPGVQALQVIREAFTRQRALDLDWPSVFDKLWAPVQRALNDPVSARALSETQTSGSRAAITDDQKLPRQIPA